MSRAEVPAPVRRVLDQLPHPMLLVDLDGRIVHANPACSELVGDEEGRDRTLLGLTTDGAEHVDGLLDRWAGSAHLRPGRLHVVTDPGSPPVAVHAEGARVPELDLILVRCREQIEALDGFGELAREIETRNLRQMKRQLESTIEDVRSTNQRLEAANEELDRYAAVVSHDLRTPLTTIAGFVELLRMDHSDGLDREGLHILEILERNTARMGAAIDALLQLARTKDPPEHPTVLDPAEVLGDVLEQIGTEIQQAEIHVDPLPEVAVDRTHLSQVLQNLLTNSVRYRSPDRPLEITISGRSHDGMVELTVSDTGIGIPEDERERVFEPLRRGRRVEHIEGTGIGLATCRKIVRSYGGDIEVRGDGGEAGTTIAFTVPAG